MTLRLRAFAFRPEGLDGQRVMVSTREIGLVRWQVSADAPAVYRVDIPPGLAVPGQPFFIDLVVSDPVPVSQFVPGSTDTRKLGVKAQALRVGPLEPSPAR